MTGLTSDTTEVAVMRHSVLQLRFADGVTGEVDVLARMGGPVFDQARTEGGFAQARALRLAREWAALHADDQPVP